MALTLLDRTRALLERAATAYAGSAEAEGLAALTERLDEPLRVAIAGKVKAGKSTLLNALVGEELAPTDEGECTKVVTWYRDGISYRVTLVPLEGEPRQVPFARDAGAIDIDLGGTDTSEIAQLEVEWPSSALRQLTLIDTPGIASLSSDVSRRATDFLAPDEEQATPADAVLYLMRHLHTTDLDFLEAFHDDEHAQANPVNAIGVLSRADEVAVGRLDAMVSANRIAMRYRHDPVVRRLVQTVVPVAGLLAQTACTLREAEYRALADIAAAEPDTVSSLLLSADRFLNSPAAIALTDLERQHLLDRLGLFGVHLAVTMIRDRGVDSASRLAVELTRASGLNELRAALLSHFAQRRDVLKARSALLALEALLHRSPTAESPALAAELEQLVAGAHELAELRVLNAVRAGEVVAGSNVIIDLERLLGADGAAVTIRLDLPPDADGAAIRNAAAAAHATWQRRAENPLSDPTLVSASRVLIRTCEGILSEFASS